MISSTSNDPVSLGEVDRNVQKLSDSLDTTAHRLSDELRSGLKQISDRMDRALDKAVPADVYNTDKGLINYQIQDLQKEVAELNTDIEKKIGEIKNDQVKKEEITRGQRNMFIVAFAFPLVILILNTGINFYFKASGK